MKDIIGQAVEKAKKNRALYQRSEMATRDHLINPILNELGWLISDPDRVVPNEPSEEGGKPDYTLKKEGRIISFVEAKKLSASLDDHINQLAKYCYAQGAEFGILTNGIQWMLLRTFEPGKKLPDRVVWQIDLKKVDP